MAHIAMKIALWEDQKCPLTSVPHECKLLLALRRNVNGEAICQVYYTAESAQANSQPVHHIMDLGHSSMQRFSSL